MAKLKIRGYSELVDIPNEVAKKLKVDLLDKSVAPDDMIDVGRAMAEKRDIVAVFLDGEIREEVSGRKQYDEYYRERDAMLSLSPSERAQKNSWGYFKLFYWGIHDKEPEEREYKDKVLQAATQFFEDNSYWIVPSVRCFYSILGLTQEYKVREDVLGIIENVEARQEVDAAASQKFYEGQLVPL